MKAFTFQDNPKFHHVKHPLIEHKLAILRDEKTLTKQFVELAEEIAAHEAAKELSDKKLEVVAPDFSSEPRRKIEGDVVHQ